MAVHGSPLFLEPYAASSCNSGDQLHSASQGASKVFPKEKPSTLDTGKCICVSVRETDRHTHSRYSEDEEGRKDLFPGKRSFVAWHTPDMSSVGFQETFKHRCFSN